MDGGVAQAVKHLPSKCKAQSSNPSTTTTNNNNIKDSSHFMWESWEAAEPGAGTPGECLKASVLTSSQEICSTLFHGPHFE
jgi:hypothetical protein